MNENDYSIRMIEMVDSVQTIYQYMSIAGGKPMLAESTIMLKNPSEFNDPYDCYTGLISHKYIPSSFRKDAIKLQQPESNRKKRREDLKIAKKVNDEEISKIFTDRFLPQEFSSRGVSCFSQSNDNMLMWAH